MFSKTFNSTVYFVSTINEWLVVSPIFVVHVDLPSLKLINHFLTKYSFIVLTHKLVWFAWKPTISCTFCTFKNRIIVRILHLVGFRLSGNYQNITNNTNVATRQRPETGTGSSRSGRKWIKIIFFIISLF